MIIPNTCPHCGGDIEPDENTETYYVVCISCGWRRDTKPKFSYLKANANGPRSFLTRVKTIFRLFLKNCKAFAVILRNSSSGDCGRTGKNSPRTFISTKGTYFGEDVVLAIGADITERRLQRTRCGSLRTGLPPCSGATRFHDPCFGS